MARDEVLVQLPTLDSSKSLATLADTTASTVTQANGTKLTGFAGCKNNSLHITISNSASSASAVTFKAGDFANNVMGDLTQPIAASKTATFIIDNPSRFQTKDGSILIDYASGFTGTIYAVGKHAGLKKV